MGDKAELKSVFCLAGNLWVSKPKIKIGVVKGKICLIIINFTYGFPMKPQLLPG